MIDLLKALALTLLVIAGAVLIASAVAVLAPVMLFGGLVFVIWIFLKIEQAGKVSPPEDKG